MAQSLSLDWEKLSSKANSNHVQVVEDLDRVIADLESLKDLIQRGSQIEGFQIKPDNSLQPIMNRSKSASKAALQAHKELHALSSKWAKVIDKKFSQTVLPLLGTNLVPNQSPEGPQSKQPFRSQAAQQALNQVITNHLLRQGRFETAHLFACESQVTLSTRVFELCQELYRITDLLQAGDITVALRWAESHRDWLNARESPLEFDLHRSQFVKLLTEPAFNQHSSCTPSSTEGFNVAMEVEHPSSTQSLNPPCIKPIEYQKNQLILPTIIEPSSDSKMGLYGHSSQELAYLNSRRRALDYARDHFPKFFPRRWDEAVRLTSSSLYTPFSRLQRSPYSEFYRSSGTFNASGDGKDQDKSLPWLHADHLVPLFIKEYCARLEWSKELPLIVATELGSGGALAKIAKVRSVMKEKRTEWSQADELPVEIPLPMEFRFHSVFACPVSKEQATETNPPMMMPCGHVIAKESMQKLAKGGGTVKCPYCPSSSSMSSAVQVYF